ncbi:acyltransferase family protein, partial [Rothia nasimurium]
MKDDHVFYSAVHPHEGQRRFVLRGLDGVRAIAVLLVLVYHFWPQYLPGGMIGVDIFFVISGYLITALLLREGAYTGKMDIVSFWVRRLRRLVPAFALLTLVVGS